MKKYIAVLMLLLLFMAMLPVSAYNTEASEAIFLEYEGMKYICLESLAAQTDIIVNAQENGFYLSEDGLKFDFQIDSVFVYRDDYIMGAMEAVPLYLNGKYYVPEDFYDSFLCKGGGAPSLYNGALFYPYEVLAALDEPAGSVFNQKLMNAISIPTSMNIETAHIAVERVFVDTKLTEYPPELSVELQQLGYSNPEAFTYSEYMVICGLQTLAEAGISSVVETFPELQDVDPNEMTVAEYTIWQSNHAGEQYRNGLSNQAKRFMEEKNISLADFIHLNRYFSGTYLEQSDTILKEVLSEYYQMDIDYLCSAENPFDDVEPENWFYEDVMFVLKKKLMTGVSATTFAPQCNTTRGMIVTILWRMSGQTAPLYPCQFTDVAKGTYYELAVAWAAENGIVNGYSDTEFKPDANITREQLAAILFRYAQYKGYDVSVGENTNILSYTDSMTISEYAIPAMQWACGAGLINGIDGALRPAGYANRAQTAAILARFCQTF